MARALVVLELLHQSSQRRAALQDRVLLSYAPGTARFWLEPGVRASVSQPLAGLLLLRAFLWIQAHGDVGRIVYHQFVGQELQGLRNRAVGLQPKSIFGNCYPKSRLRFRRFPA